MRRDRTFVLEHQDKVKGLGRLIDTMMPAEVFADSTNSIKWQHTGIDFRAISQAVRDTYGVEISARLFQYGQTLRHRKRRPAGLCLRGYSDNSAEYIPIWIIQERDLTKNNLIQLCWIFDQAQRGRSRYGHLGQVRGPIYGSGIVKRILERAYDPMRLRMMLEATARKRESYEFSIGQYPNWAEVKISMKLNYASASIQAKRRGEDYSHLSYSGNMITAVIPMAESVVLGLKGRYVDDIIDWDILKGSGLKITSANYLPDHGGTLRLGVTDPQDIQIIEADPE